MWRLKCVRQAGSLRALAPSSKVYASDRSKPRVPPKSILNARRDAKLALPARPATRVSGLRAGHGSYAGSRASSRESPILALGLCHLVASTTRRRICLSTEVPERHGILLDQPELRERDTRGVGASLPEIPDRPNQEDRARAVRGGECGTSSRPRTMSFMPASVGTSSTTHRTPSRRDLRHLQLREADRRDGGGAARAGRARRRPQADARFLRRARHRGRLLGSCSSGARRARCTTSAPASIGPSSEC